VSIYVTTNVDVAGRSGVCLHGLRWPWAVYRLGTAGMGCVDTIEVTGSIPVSPTSFERLYAAGSQKGSQTSG
jgi:hypothetical protein